MDGQIGPPLTTAAVGIVAETQEKGGQWNILTVVDCHEIHKTKTQ